MFPKLFKPIFIEIEIYENWKFIYCVLLIYLRIHILCPEIDLY